MAKKTKTEIEQAASTETASTPAPTAAKKRAATKPKAPAAEAKAPAKRAAAPRATAKKSVVEEVVIEVAGVTPAAELHMAVALSKAGSEEGVSAETTVMAVDQETEERLEAALDTAAVFDEVPTREVADEREEIARIAYSYWEARNFAPGDPLHDWLRAEHEFRVRRYATV